MVIGILAVVLAVVGIAAVVRRGVERRRSRWAAVAVEAEAERRAAELAPSYWPDVVSHRHSFIRLREGVRECGDSGT